MSTPDCHGETSSLPPSNAKKVLLVGRPNAGKSSLYNRITGGNAKVGNFPGVTVDILEAEAFLVGHEPLRLIDLPGIYSLEAKVDPESDEGITRGFIERAEQDGDSMIAQIIDVTQLALHLRLTRELLKRKLPVVLLLTQADILQSQGQEIDAEAISKDFGVPALVLSARDPNAKISALEFLTKHRKRTASPLTPDPSLAPVGTLDASPSSLPVASSGEGQVYIKDRSDISAADKNRRERTKKLDAYFLHPLLGPVLFVVLMTTIFASVFLIADPVSTVVDGAMQWLADFTKSSLGEGLLSSLIADAILGGVGTVLIFLPQIVILSLVMELLEASGYLARGAFLIDSFLRVFGLGGRSFVPLLTGHACAVPAITATRIIRDPKQRLRTILVIPLITCSARIPTYGLLIAAFMASSGALVQSLVFVSLYALGIIFACLVSFVLQKTVKKGNALPLVLEMPAYRVPEISSILRAVWRVVSAFVREVGTYILIASILLWALLTIPAPKSLQHEPPPNAPESVVQLHQSVAATIGQSLEPLTAPLGFDWRINVGLIGSFSARELMVSTTGIIFGIEDADSNTETLAEEIAAAKKPDGTKVYTLATGLSLMIFFVLACQCMSTVAALKRETHSWRWPIFVVVYTYVLAYVASLVVYQIASALGL
jgi:ferrous iron transport protein B